ncbi:hypothetical protein N5C46_08200 [Rossellomorea vietnamensis]|uniref:Uncharacterized protein n=1 Tax=Rossellomorea vietnamensis TaxID=218284 RepID=A0ACD4CBX2_9BACI|nr:hypothetical protein [Rossellomorea vietnamensis]UXH46013.1 hypothetical protein N5C46_08200 [Rossellomorea vietnamensis]
MSEKNNPLEGLMDLINQYTKEDGSKLDLESAKEKLSSLLSEDHLKGLLDSQGKGSLDAMASLGNLGGMANVMNMIPMVEKVVNKHMYKKPCESYKHDDCKKDKHQDIKDLLEDILCELKKIKNCTCHTKKHECYKDNWEHWY